MYGAGLNLPLLVVLLEAVGVGRGGRRLDGRGGVGAGGCGGLGWGKGVDLVVGDIMMMMQHAPFTYVCGGKSILRHGPRRMGSV